MLFISFQKSLPTLVFIILALAYVVYRAKSIFLLYNNDHVFCRSCLMILKIIGSLRQRFANITISWHLLLWLLMWTIKPSKDLVLHHFGSMVHSTILWEPSCHQMVLNLPMLNSISMIQRKQLIGVFNITSNWMLESC